MRARPLGPKVELSVGHDTCEGCADMSAAAPCEYLHWGLRWSSLWDTTRVRGVRKWARRRHASTSTRAARGVPAPWDTKRAGGRAWPRRRLPSTPNWAVGVPPLGGTKHMKGVFKQARRRHASTATGAVGGGPCGARNVRRVCPNRCGGAIRAPPLGPWVEVRVGRGSSRGGAELGAAAPCEHLHWGREWSSL